VALMVTDDPQVTVPPPLVVPAPAGELPVVTVAVHGAAASLTV
jgi:hypothetical protein